MSNRRFLSARWEYLAMFNYTVPPEIVQKHLPIGTELDFFNGQALVSIVGFLFNDTKVMGVRWPGHINFEEANLRYYVKRYDGKEWKRGVGFVSEIVPKPLVATMANLLYNEHYSTAKMAHHIKQSSETISVEYRWQKRKQYLNVISVQAKSLLEDIKTGSEEEFIFEHYYGYNQLNKTTTIEYAVEHPRWQIYPVNNFSLDCDIENLYGKEFVPFIQDKEPHSVFLAKGSEVSVRMPKKINTESGRGI